jgi:hypothetical protein
MLSAGIEARPRHHESRRGLLPKAGYLVYELELAPVAGVKDMRNQEGLRPIKRYECSRLFLTTALPNG